MNNYAGFLQRIRAFFFDYVFILIYLAAITVVMWLLNSLFSINDLLFADGVHAHFFGFLFVTLPVILYFSISESSALQATWGKQRARLNVTNYNGEQISFRRSLARTLLKSIAWELSHTLIRELSFSPETEDVLIYYGFGLVYLLVGLNIANLLLPKKHQTIYDLLSKTYVVQEAR